MTGSVIGMGYLLGASRTKLIRLKHLEPGTRVQATDRIPSGPCHAVADLDADTALCGAEVVEVFDQSFTGDAELLRCGDCETLVKEG